MALAPKKLIVVILIVVVVLIAFVLGLTFALEGRVSANRSPYKAVYMATGDIYFGKMSWFPKPRLKGVWYLQRGVDQNSQPQLGVAPFSRVFWGPVDEIYLNPRQIVFWTSLRADSELAKALANPSLLEQFGEPAQSDKNPSPLNSGSSR